MKKNFFDFYKQLPDEIRQMIDRLGVSSFEDMFGLAVIMGVDLNKLEKCMDDGSLATGKVKFEDLLTDTSPLKERNSNNASVHADDDPFAFPVNCFIGDEPKELHLRVKLLNSPVPVWREIKVPSNVTLEYFSFIINCVMRWENTHLHLFKINDTFYKNTVCLKMDNEIDLGFRTRLALDTNMFPISHFFKEKKDRIKYEYDFGDSWMHEIWLKGIREYGPDDEYAIEVVKGKGACPPEDCGGVWGYQDLLELSTKGRKTKEEKERLKWFGIDKDYDPEYFDVDYAQYDFDDLWMMAIRNEYIRDERFNF